MKKHSKVALTLGIFTLAMATAAMAGDAFVGTWKLNLEKSGVKTSGPGTMSLTMKIEAQDNGINESADLVYPNGTTNHREFAAKFDGKDYPLSGSADTDTIVLTRIDANTFDSVGKKAGKETSTVRNVVSKDGKTLTATTKTINAQGQTSNFIMVFDKQ